MNIKDKKIDGGKAFDWGKTSADYARFRDIYPQEFYDKLEVTRERREKLRLATEQLAELIDLQYQTVETLKDSL